ncbi:MAG: hypothetical protein ACOYK6_01605 [Chthoniobacterales bacterium]
MTPTLDDYKSIAETSVYLPQRTRVVLNQKGTGFITGVQILPSSSANQETDKKTIDHFK